LPLIEAEKEKMWDLDLRYKIAITRASKMLLFLLLAFGSADAQVAGESQISNEEKRRRTIPAPLDGIFPSTDYLGPPPLIGVPDTDPVYQLTKAVWAIAPALRTARIKIYGWANPGVSVSSSNKSNIPESYAIVPNRPELDQGKDCDGRGP